MKRIFALIIAISFALTVMPAFAGGEATSAPAEGTLFQIIHDSLESELVPKGEPSREVTIFKTMQSKVEAWDDTAGNAKPLSLRDNPEEVARRRGVR